MAEAAVYIFFIVSLFILLRMRWEFVFWLPLFNVLADMSFSFFSGFSSPTIIRAAINLLFIFFAFKNYPEFRLRYPVYLFFLLLALLLTTSGEFIYSLRGVVQVMISTLMLLIGYSVCRSTGTIKPLIVNLRFILYATLFSTLAGYVFNIGRTLEYTADTGQTSTAQFIGLLGSGGLFISGIVIGLFPVLIKFLPDRRVRLTTILSAALVLLFIILNVRRTAIIIPILGLSGFLVTSGPVQKKTTIRFIIFTGLFLLMTYPIYSDVLEKRIGIRKEQGRFETDFYKSEARYFDHVVMFDQIVEFEDPLKVLFGYGNNVLADQYLGDEVNRRMIHSDFPKIYYSLGLFGVITYLVILAMVYLSIITMPKHRHVIDFRGAAMGLFFILIFATLNGSITLFSFRTVLFLLLGAFFGYTKHFMNKNGNLPVITR